MRKLRGIIVGMLWLLVAVPTESSAQTKEQAEDFVEDVLWALFGPNWNAFLHTGATTSGRFMLQSAGVGTSNTAQRSLRGNTGFNIGGGAGVDILLRMGFRLSYTFTKSDLIFRTDIGDGSTAFDMDDIVGLKSSIITGEVLRYMLPARMAFTPYASAGVVAAWWSLDEGSTLIVPTGGSTQFRPGAIAAVGLQGMVNDHLSVRLEGTWASVRNPFTGNESFRVTGGAILDEPTRVRKTDFRLAFIYYFNRPNLPQLPENGQENADGRRGEAGARP